MIEYDAFFKILLQKWIDGWKRKHGYNLSEGSGAWASVQGSALNHSFLCGSKWKADGVNDRNFHGRVFVLGSFAVSVWFTKGSLIHIGLLGSKRKDSFVRSSNAASSEILQLHCNMANPYKQQIVFCKLFFIELIVLN